MKRNNTRVTRTEQARAEAAAKRRTKRKAERAALVAPYIKRVELLNSELLKQTKEAARLRLKYEPLPANTSTTGRDDG